MTKRILAIVWMSVLAVSGVMAQHHGQWELYVTPKVGGLYSNFTKQTGDWKPGFVGAANVETFFNDHLSMAFEMGFTMQGANNVPFTLEYTKTSTGETERIRQKYDYRLNYLNTAYLFRWYFTQGLAVQAGVQTESLVHARAYNSTWSDIKDELHKGDFTLPVGVAMNIGNKLEFDARYHIGFKKIAKTNKAKTLLDGAKRQYVTVTMGYRINFW